MSNNIVYEHFSVKCADRERLNGQKSVCLWFTGLSGSGKSTIANLLEELLFGNGNRTYLLDGDNVRHGLNKDLDFSEEGRRENIRRIGELNQLFLDAGIITLNTFISPYRIDRDTIRNSVQKSKFLEIYIKTDIATCERRDPKGLYAKARKGEIRNFTGIDSPYEEPLNPELTIVNSDDNDAASSAETVFNYLTDNHYITKRINLS